MYDLAFRSVCWEWMCFSHALSPYSWLRPSIPSHPGRHSPLQIASLPLSLPPLLITDLNILVTSLENSCAQAIDIESVGALNWTMSMAGTQNNTKILPTYNERRETYLLMILLQKPHCEEHCCCGAWLAHMSPVTLSRESSRCLSIWLPKKKDGGGWRKHRILHPLLAMLTLMWSAGVA